jgi:hypothetical protein
MFYIIKQGSPVYRISAQPVFLYLLLAVALIIIIIIINRRRLRLLVVRRCAYPQSYTSGSVGTARASLAGTVER